jgi:hypothetical protein
MDQVVQTRINRGLDHFSPLCTADWTGLWQTVQADLQSAPAREEHCPGGLIEVSDEVAEVSKMRRPSLMNTRDSAMSERD